MIGPVLWYGTLCGALAGAALPHACAQIVASLRPRVDAEHVAPVPRARLPPPGGWSPQHTRDAILSGLGLAAASAGVAWLLNEGPDGLLLVAVWLVVLYAGLLLAVVDVVTRRLPTPIVAAAALAVGGLLAGHAFITGQTRTLVTAALAAGALGGGYLFLAIGGGSGMGMGDVRLAALLGASLGTLGWPAVLWGGLLPYALAAPEALTRLALRRQPDLAFGPYLLAGAFLSVALVGP
ncbi:prepilin peptidase [Micromonospora sp. NPDC048930]|uniref:prepilin peptidase n=1 Tax=Micromonospora sp. NPDC048930 TaxID=3364261 RepID=UPI003723433D